MRIWNGRVFVGHGHGSTSSKLGCTAKKVLILTAAGPRKAGSECDPPLSRVQEVVDAIPSQLSSEILKVRPVVDSQEFDASHLGEIRQML